MIAFIIPGSPQGKARARTGRGFAFTPEKTSNYEALVKQIYWTAARKEGLKMFEKGVMLAIEINAYYAIPESESKKKKEAMKNNLCRPVKTPDVDNITKIICDALNKIAYWDDSQIVEQHCYKYYSDTPRVEVILKQVS